MRRFIYIFLGHVTVVLGIIGIFLPVLPTTPFLLLTAYFYSRGSERFHRWLLAHPRLGPPIKDWQAHGVISRRSKVIALVLICASLSVPIFVVPLPLWLRMAVAAIGGGALLFIFSRPSTSREEKKIKD